LYFILCFIFFSFDLYVSDVRQLIVLNGSMIVYWHPILSAVRPSVRPSVTQSIVAKRYRYILQHIVSEQLTE